MHGYAVYQVVGSAGFGHRGGPIKTAVVVDELPLIDLKRKAQCQYRHHAQGEPHRSRNQRQAKQRQPNQFLTNVRDRLLP